MNGKYGTIVQTSNTGSIAKGILNNILIKCDKSKLISKGLKYKSDYISKIEKQIIELEQQETDISKEQLNIAKAKIDALDSNYYEKI